MNHPPIRQFTAFGHPFDMILVEGGTFRMGMEKDDPDAYGDEQPVHDVTVSGFYLGKLPVTQMLWQAVMGDTPSHFPGGQRPVEHVSWDDAQKFVKKLQDQTRLPFRLPSEAEWEFAARGGIYNLNHNYAGSNRLKEVGWHYLNSHGESKSAGRKFPNELGLYDMSGDVWEWCEDWFGGSEYYRECHEKGLVVDPVGPERGSCRVHRGGSWDSHPRRCRTAARNDWLPGNRSSHLGFRLALSLQSEE